MATTTVCQEIDGERLVHGLQEVLDRLDSSGGEVVVNFSAVRRIDSSGLKAIETLAGAAGSKSVKVVLSGVNAGVYKVLKLVQLAPRFSFRN